MQGVAARVTVAVLIAAGFTGCGDDRLTRREFIQRADAICENVKERTSDLGAPTSKAEFVEKAREARRITLDATSRIRRLEPPESDEAAIDRWLSNMEAAVRLLPDVAAAFEAEDLDEVQRLTVQIQERAADARRIAGEYGFRECGQVAPGE